jgi:hypothetical protein
MNYRATISIGSALQVLATVRDPTARVMAIVSPRGGGGRRPRPRTRPGCRWHGVKGVSRAVVAAGGARVGAVQPPSAVRHQQGAAGVAAECRVDRPDGPWRQWHQRALAALADHGQDPMGPLHPEVGDVGGARLRHPQAVQGEQAGKGVVAGGGSLGGAQEPDRLVAVQSKRLRVVRRLATPNVGDGGVGERALLDRVAVEAGQGGQPRAMVARLRSACSSWSPVACSGVTTLSTPRSHLQTRSTTSGHTSRLQHAPSGMATTAFGSARWSSRSGRACAACCACRTAAPGMRMVGLTLRRPAARSTRRSPVPRSSPPAVALPLPQGGLGSSSAAAKRPNCAP